MQFKKGTKESEYLQVLQQLQPENILKICPFVFKDRLFASISNFCYTMICQERRAFLNQTQTRQHTLLFHQDNFASESPLQHQNEFLQHIQKWTSVEEAAKDAV